MSNTHLHESYQTCIAISRSSGSSFPWLFRLLPKSQQNAMYAVYAYCRVLDDTVDNDRPEAEKRIALDNACARLQNALNGEGESEIYPAVADTIENYQLPIAPFQDLARGMAFDLASVSIATESELLQYCDWVAGTVGQMIVGVCRVPHDIGYEYAIATGRAMQLTNILRDIRADFDQQRVYVPREWLQQYGVSVPDLIAPSRNDSSDKLLQQFSEKAVWWYAEAKRLLPASHRKELLFAEAISDIYRSLFDLLQRDGIRYNRKVSVPFFTKGGILLKFAMSRWFG